MSKFNVAEYLQYFKSTASLHPSIKGFYTMDINEVLGDLRQGMQYPALILNSVNGFLSENLSAENTQNLVKAGFMVIDHADSLDDFTREMQILGETFDWSMDILTRIKNDAAGSSRSNLTKNSGIVKLEICVCARRDRSRANNEARRPAAPRRTSDVDGAI